MTAPSSTPARGLGFALLIVLIAINLRAFLASSSPLLPDLHAAIGLDLHAAALLTMLPMAAMGLMSLFGVSLGRHIGTRAGVLCGLAAIAAACAARGGIDHVPPLLASAALAGLGVGTVQALMPAVVKRAYPAHTGVAMGLYSAALMGGGGLGALGAPWIARLSGQWRWGLAAWALPAMLAMLAWTRARLNDTPATPAVRVDWRPCLRNRRAWALVLFFGLINGGYTSLVAWLPPFYAAQGWDSAHAGAMLALMTLAQLVAALAVPALAHGRRDLRPWLSAMLVLQVAGFAALALRIPAPLLVVPLLGLGLGGAFALSMALAMDHLPHPAQAGALTAFMQGLGFILAALSPLASGWLQAQAGGFAAAWAALGAVPAVLLALTWRFDPRGYAQAVGGLFDAADGVRPSGAGPAAMSACANGAAAPALRDNSES